MRITGTGTSHFLSIKEMATLGEGMPPTLGLVPFAILPALGERMVARPFCTLDNNSRDELGVGACTHHTLSSLFFKLTTYYELSVSTTSNECCGS
jgi:hypothetical protein